jgi:hypothetical protein
MGQENLIVTSSQSSSPGARSFAGEQAIFKIPSQDVESVHLRTISSFGNSCMTSELIVIGEFEVIGDVYDDTQTICNARCHTPLVRIGHTDEGVGLLRLLHSRLAHMHYARWRQ